MHMTSTRSGIASVRTIASFSNPASSINGLISFDLQAFKARREGGPQLDPVDQFFQLSGAVELFGIADSWNFSVFTIGSTRFPVWTREDFQFVVRSLNNAAGSHVLPTQVRSPLHVVDLSLIEVGQTFHVRLTAKASTYNEIAGPPSEFPTSIGAYMRGSLKLGGAVLEFSELDVIGMPIPLPQSPAEDQITWCRKAGQGRQSGGGRDPVRIH